jgi:hypothetical protein
VWPVAERKNVLGAGADARQICAVPVNNEGTAFD